MITFNLYSGASGTGIPVFTSMNPISGVSATSGDFTPATAGTYSWVATYNGDTNNASATSAVGTVTITTFAPTISVTAAPAGPVYTGTALGATAAVSGGSSPTGAVTFELYDVTGSATRVFTDTVMLSGGSVSSGTFTPTNAGTYQWIAVYSGDANNASASNSGSPVYVTVLALTSPLINGEASGTDTIDLTVGDPAYSRSYTITGGPAPTLSVAGIAGATVTNAGVLTIPAGLAAGTYTATITAANGVAPDATMTVSVNVNAPTVKPPKFTVVPPKITNASTDAVFIIDGPFTDLSGVSINGTALKLGAANSAGVIPLSGWPGYTGSLGDAVEHSVKITLYKEFLATLPNGTYTLTVSFSDSADVVYASPTAEFVINRATTTTIPGMPQTSDDVNIIPFWFLLVNSFFAILLIMEIRRLYQFRAQRH